MEITQTENGYVVPCRQWASEHLGLDMKYEYRTKRNALRATTCPKRNQKTRLAYYAKQCYDRVVHLELIFMSFIEKLDSYDFSEFDAGESFCDGGSAGGVDFETAGDDSRSGSGSEGCSGEDGSPDSGDGGTDEGARGALEGSSLSP